MLVPTHGDTARPSMCDCPPAALVQVHCPNIAVGHSEWNPRPAMERGGKLLPAVPKDIGSGGGDVSRAGEWKPRIERKYTPCSLDCHLGFFDLIIKVYRPNKRFAHGGKVSQFMDSLQLGDSLDIQGPFGLLEYFGRGVWKKYGRRTKLGLMAGGSGVTPMLQVIQAVLLDPRDNTEISLLYANQTEADIIVRDMLDGWARDHAQFNVWYTLDRPADDWQYSRGFITAEMIAAHLPAPADDTLVLMCGPPPMLKFACKPNLAKLGYDMKRGVACF